MNTDIQQLKQERIYDVPSCHYATTAFVGDRSYTSKGARQGAMSLYATMPAYNYYSFATTGDVSVSEFVSDTEYYEYLDEDDE